MVESIFHLVPQAEWARGQDPHVLATLDTEGFVHCSTSDQVAEGADTLFAGRQDLLLLEIDPSKLSAEVAWEDLYDLDEDFPHVCGPIERSAVVRSSPYVPNGRGRFEPPGR